MLIEYKNGKYYQDGVEIEKPAFDTLSEQIMDSIVINNEIESGGSDDNNEETPVTSKPLPTDIPCVYFDSILPTSKDQGNIKSSCHIRSSKFNINCYATLKVQGNSSTAYNKKNFTITFYSDKECTSKLKIDFGWGAQAKYVMKANWIDITHSRNIVSARLWGDVVKSRTDYNTLPELLRTSPNQGAIDGFPIKFYGNNIYWGRYTMNIPKDPWMTNMVKTNPQQLILCGENYNEALFRAPAVWDETDWTDELHDEVPAELLARFNELVDFVRNSSDEDFKAHLADYVDLQSVVDYYVFGLLICNLDGFGKNHIWLSYDGNKFIASAYDMDSTFGLYWDGSQLLAPTYQRTSFEDMVNGRLGNLMYIRLVDNFMPELQNSYKRIAENNGPMTFVNVLDRFENFINIAPVSLVQEDYAGTTGNGACTDIPSQNTNNIQQIRQWYTTRLAYVKANLGVIDDADIIELPEPFAMWENLMFDGDGTKHTPLNTGYQLFSNDPEWQVWTLQFHAKILPGTTGQRSAVHCMDETGDPWPGMVMQTQNQDVDGTITEIRMTKASSGNIEGITFNNGAEQYIALQRNGSTMKYCIDGKTWNTFPGTVFEHTAPLVLGGYCNGQGQVLGGADGREINGYVTARLWKENLDNVAQLFIEQFPEDMYDFEHNLKQLSFNDIDSMQVGESITVSMVNPHLTNGYILGKNATSAVGVTGTSTLMEIKKLVDQNIDNNTYKFNISKVAETVSEEHEVTNQVAKTFTVTNGGSVTLTKQTSSIEGYDLYRATLTRNGTRQVNIAFDGTLPQNVYLKAYRSNTTASSYTVSLTGGTGTVTASTNNTTTSLTNFTQVSQTAATLNVSCTLSNTQGTYYLYILVPNNITESVTTTETVEIPTGNEYYTIKSVNTNEGPTGTDGIATWSTSLMYYTVANATSLASNSDISRDINTVGNSNLIRFINPSGNFLNAGGSPTDLKFANGTGEWSVWLLYVTI